MEEELRKGGLVNVLVKSKGPTFLENFLISNNRSYWSAARTHKRMVNASIFGVIGAQQVVICLY